MTPNDTNIQQAKNDEPNNTTTLDERGILTQKYLSDGLVIKDFKLGTRIAMKVLGITSVLIGLLLAYILYLTSDTFLTAGVVFISDVLNASIPVAIILISLLLGVFIAIRAFSVNTKLRIVDGYLIVPETDVANTIIDFITMRPIIGYFFYKFIPVKDIIDIKLDGHGDSNLKNFPLTVTDSTESNQLDFSSRQKRDEFGFKLSVIAGKSYEQTAQMGSS